MPHDQLQKLYRRSDLHVYLSRAFVLSWSLLELMACGTPVLAEANPMMEELIKPGSTVRYGAGEPETLAKAIITLLQEPEKLKSWEHKPSSIFNPLFSNNIA